MTANKYNVKMCVHAVSSEAIYLIETLVGFYIL
jgi:hypothetical protein